MPHGKRADGATQLDVERMIIDFLIHMANKSIFDDYERTRSKSKRVSYVAGEQCEKHLQMVQSFSSIFRNHFPGERLEPRASFRSKLLQFSVLFSQRTMLGLSADCLPFLESLRTSHGRRTSYLSAAKCSSPLGKSASSQLPIGIEYRSHYVEKLCKHGCVSTKPSLMDLQPLFFKLSNYRTVLESNSSSLRRDWMNLAGQFMFQVAIEQLLVHGTKDSEVIRGAFSWTWKEDKNVDEMFADQGEKEVTEWEHIRSSWAALIKPTSKSTSLARHILQVAAQYPLHEFEQCMVGFLVRLHMGMSPPLLNQLEDGQLEGLSVNQCSDLLQRVSITA